MGSHLGVFGMEMENKCVSKCALWRRYSVWISLGPALRDKAIRIAKLKIPWLCDRRSPSQPYQDLRGTEHQPFQDLCVISLFRGSKGATWVPKSRTPTKLTHGAPWRVKRTVWGLLCHRSLWRGCCKSERVQGEWVLSTDGRDGYKRRKYLN